MEYKRKIHDTRDKPNLKSKTKTSQRSRWSTSTDAPPTLDTAQKVPPTLDTAQKVPPILDTAQKVPPTQDTAQKVPAFLFVFVLCSLFFVLSGSSGSFSVEPLCGRVDRETPPYLPTNLPPHLPLFTIISCWRLVGE